MHRFLFLFVVAGLLTASGAENARDAVRALFASGNYAGARDVLAEQAKSDPKNPEVHYWLGVAAEHLRDTDAAVRELEQATALDPKNAMYMLELGGAYGTAAEKAGLFAKLSWARKCQGALEKAVALDPDNVAARQGLISFYRAAPSFAGGSRPKAFEQAEEIRKRDPIAGAAVLGQLYVDDGKADRAFALYDEALKNAPDNYGLLYGFGRAAAQTGQQLERGEQCLRRCLALQPACWRPLDT